jgi:hypothetical protein
VEKDLLPALGIEDMAVISTVMPSLNKGNMEILFGKPLHVQIGK